VNTSVVVPSYRRATDLRRCLAALATQVLPADQVIVVARPDDTDTLEVVREFLDGVARPRLAGLEIASVTRTGVVAAYNRGLDAATGDLVSITDDDAAPHPDWIANIVRHFQLDPRVGGVGGRDLIHEHGRLIEGEMQRVGEVSWYGRLVGNHHIGGGLTRPVQVLKGVNMSWRAAAIKDLHFDWRLRGTGAQVHVELGFGFEVTRRGWKLIYDPSLRVDHFPAPRADEDQRNSFNEVAFLNSSFNLRLVMFEYLSPLRRLAFLLYSLFIGNRADPGVVRAMVLAAGRDGWRVALKKWLLGVRATRLALNELGVSKQQHANKLQ
jgi:glycosyltransferase involved in cell wall biosynthesis